MESTMNKNDAKVALSITKKSITWSGKQVCKMIKNGAIRFDHIVQRSLVWEQERKSALIESIILGFPIPPVWAKQRAVKEGEEVIGRSGNVYDLLDGKQRLNAISSYINNDYALTQLLPITYENENGEMITVDISGMTYEKLPEELQDIIKDLSISVNYFDGLSKDEERELFKRLNAGKPLSTKSNLLASCKDIEGVMEIASHELFEQMLTAKAKENKNQVTLVMKCWAMLNMAVEEISFATKDFSKLIESTIISETEAGELGNIFTYLLAVHDKLVENAENKKIAKKLFTETHFIALIPWAKKADEREISTDQFAEWFINFFSNVNEDYDNACGSGVAKNANIVARHNALKESFENFFECASDDEAYYEEVEENQEDENSITDNIMNDMQNLEDIEDNDTQEEQLMV